MFTSNNESEQKAAGTACELYNRKSGHIERHFVKLTVLTVTVIWML